MPHGIPCFKKVLIEIFLASAIINNDEAGCGYDLSCGRLSIGVVGLVQKRDSSEIRKVACLFLLF